MGMAGNDSLIGGAGADYIFGGAGDDWVEYDPNDATVLGGAGFDTLAVADMGDVNDTIFLFDTRFHGGDTMIANGEFEEVNLGGGNDLLIGDARADVSLDTSLTVNAGAGEDRVSLFGNGDDIVYGGAGSDRIWSSLGNDNLFGGDTAERDFFYGGAGDDTMSGGGGSDVYYVGWGDGADIIVDSFGEENILCFFYGWNTAPVDGTYYGVDIDDILFDYNDIDKIVTASITEDGRTASAAFDYGAVEVINLWETADATSIQNPPSQVHVFQWVGDENDGLFVQV
jgi:Ca2+-binding RTX toxin-like protein